MAFVPDFERLHEVLKRVMAAGFSKREAQRNICRAIADRKIKIRFHVVFTDDDVLSILPPETASHYREGLRSRENAANWRGLLDQLSPRQLVGGTVPVDIPSQLSPCDFDWRKSACKKPWNIRGGFPTFPKFCHLDLIELCSADVTRVLIASRSGAHVSEGAEQERETALRRESAPLLAQFDQLSMYGEPQERGYLLQDLLNRLFVAHGIVVAKAFQRNAGGEQIDGAFELEGWHYIVECRWREKLADIGQLDGLYVKIARSGKQTMGLFLSINGWSEHVVPLMKQNPEKSIILMDGPDLRTVLSQSLDLRRLLKGKLSGLNLQAEPFVPASKLLLP
jgi:hypothetical protein